MHEQQLAHAIEHLTQELRAQRVERGSNLCTRQDLYASELRIIAAFRGISLSEAEKIRNALRTSTDDLEKAVAEQSPPVVNPNPNP